MIQITLIVDGRKTKLSTRQTSPLQHLLRHELQVRISRRVELEEDEHEGLDQRDDAQQARDGPAAPSAFQRVENHEERGVWGRPATLQAHVR